MAPSFSIGSLVRFQCLDARIADTLENQFTEIVENRPESSRSMRADSAAEPTKLRTSP